jgi:hypothetical protein
MFLVVAAVGTFLIGRQPARVRLGQVRDQGLVLRGDILIDGLKDGVVGHYEFPLAVLDLHADVFPDFHRNRAIGEVLVQLLDGLGTVVRFLEFVRVERCAQDPVAVRCSNYRESIA